MTRPVLAICLAALLGCARTDAAPVRRLETLAEFAAQWSGGRTDPTCRRLGPRGEYLGPRIVYCQWPTVVRGAQHGTVGGNRDSISDVFHMITWERTMRDSAATKAFSDSLGAALRAQGFDEWACPGGGYVWETRKLAAALLPWRMMPDGDKKIVVMATTFPDAIDSVDCPRPPRASRKAPSA